MSVKLSREGNSTRVVVCNEGHGSRTKLCRSFVIRIKGTLSTIMCQRNSLIVLMGRSRVYPSAVRTNLVNTRVESSKASGANYSENQQKVEG